MKKIKEKNSFTLIEMLVVITIILTITGVLAINYRSRGRVDLQRTVIDISQKIREVEEMALASKEIEGEVPEGGYGVYFKSNNKDTFIIFTDKNGNGKYQPNEKISEEKIGNNIEIDNISPADGNSLSIIFTPPDPKVKINDDENVKEAEITFRRENETKTIHINKIGLISVD